MHCKGEQVLGSPLMNDEGNSDAASAFSSATRRRPPHSQTGTGLLPGGPLAAGGRNSERAAPCMPDQGMLNHVPRE